MKSFHRRSSRPAPQPVVHAPAAHPGFQRVDQLLLECGLAPSRTAAQRLIAAGRVQQKVGAGATAPIQKPSQLLPPDAVLTVAPDSRHC